MGKNYKGGFYEITKKRRRQLKFALFGDAEIDDDVLDDVKRLAKLHMELRKQEKNEKK